MRTDGFGLSYNYARAFLKVWNVREIPHTFIENLKRLYVFFNKNHHIISILSSPALEALSRNNEIKKICDDFDIDESIFNLILVVFKHNQGNLLTTILWCIIRDGMRLRGECLCEITSSHDLSSELKEKIAKNFSGILGCEIVPEFHVDPSLICGVRVKCGQFFWEKSIARRLQLFANSLELGA